MRACHSTQLLYYHRTRLKCEIFDLYKHNVYILFTPSINFYQNVDIENVKLENVKLENVELEMSNLKIPTRAQGYNGIWM